jgi:DNA-binding transcriptional regulator YiaG
MKWTVLQSPGFRQDLSRLGIGADGEHDLEKQIVRTQSQWRSIADIPGLHKIIYGRKDRKNPHAKIRVYFGAVSDGTIFLISAIEKRPDGQVLSASDRARLRRLMSAFATMLGPTGGKTEELEVVVPGDYDASAIQRLRDELGVSQAEFAQLMGVSKVLVESWEQGVRGASPLARRLFDVINDDPKGFRDKWTRAANVIE